jgi:hypothetical protein
MMKTIVIIIIIILLAVVVSLLIPGIRNAIFQLAVYGRLSIGDMGPTIDRIFMQNEAGAWAQCPGGSCYRQITPGTNGENVPFKVQIYDSNGDCDSSYDVRFDVCKNETGLPCNDANKDPDMATITGSFVPGEKNGNYCNWTATYVYLDFWKRYGNWYVNASAKDNQNATWASSTAIWLDNRVSSLSYPYPSGDTIDLGSPSLGAWVDGAGANATRNTGNTRINISWQSTNFTCSGTPECIATPIIIDNVNERLCVNNDTSRTAGCGYLNAVPMNTVWWFPTLGMRRCGTDTCSSDEDAGPNQANYTTYYSIYVATGKASGSYNNTFYINTNPCEPEPCGSGF